MARGEFTLFLQPIVSLADDTVCGHEALLRWNHPRHGLMTPSRFADLLVADRIGLLIQDHVLDMALALLRDEGERLGVLSVNFTSAQLSGPRSAHAVLDRLALHGIAPWRLCIEVTEGVMLDRAADTIMVNLRELHEAGVGIALDDFGTGYASLVHLRQLPVDRIKIDQSFVAGLDQTEDGTFPIVSAIVGLGTGLGKVVVAEGIETEAQATRLRQLGCQLGQGYLYGYPEPMVAPSVPLAIAG
ncbi:EAL domain-containing protein [Sphingomonas sp. I4]